MPRDRANRLRRAGPLDVPRSLGSLPRRYRVRYKVRATNQEHRTPGGRKGEREWEGCLAHYPARCTPKGKREEGGREIGGRRPCNQGRGAGQGERGRADRGQDRARGPGQRGGQRGSAASRIAPHCARAGRRAEGPRWQGREGGNMVSHNRASRPQRAGALGKAGCRGVLPQGSPPPKVQCDVCLRSVMHRGPAGTREEGTGRAKEVGHLGGERRQDIRSRERERRGR